jgi:hypothetical protein
VSVSVNRESTCDWDLVDDVNVQVRRVAKAGA